MKTKVKIKHINREMEVDGSILDDNFVMYKLGKGDYYILHNPSDSLLKKSNYLRDIKTFWKGFKASRYYTLYDWSSNEPIKRATREEILDAESFRTFVSL